MSCAKVPLARERCDLENILDPLMCLHLLFNIRSRGLITRKALPSLHSKASMSRMKWPLLSFSMNILTALWPRTSGDNGGLLQQILGLLRHTRSGSLSGISFATRRDRYAMQAASLPMWSLRMSKGQSPSGRITADWGEGISSGYSRQTL